MANVPPLAPELPGWLQALERAHQLATRAVRALAAAAEPEIDLEPGARALADALVALYDAFDRRTDPLHAIGRARAAFEAAQKALARARRRDEVVDRAAAALMEASLALAQAEPHFAAQRAEPPRRPRALTTSGQTPALHEVERASLEPLVRVPAPPPAPIAELPPLARPKNLGELADTKVRISERALARRQAREQRLLEHAARRPVAPPPIAPPPGFLPPIAPALSERAFLLGKMRELFEDVALAGSQREPLAGDPWRAVAFIDQRMLRAVDALAALGAPALAGIEALVLDAPIKDATRAFAAALILACFEGRDALAAAERLVHHLGPATPAIAGAVTVAWSLAPHPHLALMLRSWLGESEPAYRRIALEVLWHQGSASLAELGKAAQDPAPEVLAFALEALALAAPRQPELPSLLAEARRRAAEHAALWPAIWRALAQSGQIDALDAPLAALGAGDRTAAPAATALACDERGAAELLAALEREPSATLCEALGWAGSSRAILPLIEQLFSADEAVRNATAGALARITGAALTEEVAIEPEELLVPDLPVPEVERDERRAPSLGEQVSDPRDRPAAGSPDTVERPTTEPGRWRSWWEEQRASYRPELRYRRGRPYSSLVLHEELDRSVLAPVERRFVQLELVVRTGRFVRFDPRDFVAVQEQALSEWQPIAAAAAATPGSWQRAARRS